MLKDVRASTDAFYDVVAFNVFIYYTRDICLSRINAIEIETVVYVRNKDEVLDYEVRWDTKVKCSWYTSDCNCSQRGS